MKVQRAPQQADRGATLIIVLVIITVISLVMSVIIAQADTSIRSTIALRDQASSNYGADGATLAVLNALKTSGIDCSDPTNPTPVILGTTSSPFYSPDSTEQGPINAYVRCTPDAVQGIGTATVTQAPLTTTAVVTPAPVTSTGTVLGSTDPTLPVYALLAVGTGAGDFGIDITDSANNKIICVENGSVGSNKDINAAGETLAVRLAGTGTPGDPCTSGTGVDPVTGSRLIVTAAGTCQGTFAPTPCEPNSALIGAPAAPILSGTLTAINPAPVCSSSNTYAAFKPGLYTDATLLNTPCTGSKGSKVAARFEWFSPGTYYFDYGSTAWNWPSQTLIGGTPIDQTTGLAITGLDPNTGSTLTKLANVAGSPGACDDPANGSGVVGVSMVFAGASVVNASHSGVAEICASSPVGSPPVAINGLAASQTLTKSAALGGGTVTLPAETMCASGCGANASLIATDSSGLTEMYIKGYVYAPQAQMLLKVKNSVGQVFNWGVVVRNLSLVINGASPTQPVIHLPRPNTGIGPAITTSTPPPVTSAVVTTPAPSASTTYSIRYMNVWTCTVASLQASGASQCLTTGPPNVQVKVRTDGATLTILSWNHLR